MADSSKNLLYLLPDVAYVVELIKGKDEYTYVIKDYLQVNGNFMNEKELLGESIKKLVSKIQPKQYDLVLPDFLFTNTVINIEESGEAKVKKHLETKIIPDLKISDKTHNIQHFILTEHKNISKVQLSAMEYSILAPFKDAFSKKDEASIGQIYPLSWTIKALISLEPSISLVQMGTKLYLAQQYIGVDQASYSEVKNADKLIETIKTLKGAEPNIQSLYLLSNELVEKNLKDGLSDTLPIQQLAKPDEDSEMPSYVKQVIEAGAKTMVVPDYKLPKFSLDSVPAEGAVMPKKAKSEKVSEEEKVEPVKEEAQPDLPTPTEIGGDDEEVKADEPDKTPEEDKVEETKPETIEPVETKEADPDVDLSQFSAAGSETAEATEAEVVEDKAKPVESAPASPVEPDKPEEDKPEPEAKEVEAAKPEEDKPEETKDKKEVIKNKSGVNNMVRMIFVGLVSFFITVGVGLGLGLGFLNFTSNNQESPVSEAETAEVSPAASPTAEPTKAPEIDRTSFDVLVVNATTKAGYAGVVKSDLEDAGFEGITAKNAKGEYDESYYLLLDEENESLLKLLEEDTGFTFEFSDQKQVEDPNEEYDFVVVLGDIK